MKILVVTDSFPMLSETFVIDQVTDLIDRGHDVRVISWLGKGDMPLPVSKYNLDRRIIDMAPEAPKTLVKRYLRALGNARSLLSNMSGRLLRLFSPKLGIFVYGLVPLYVAAALEKCGWEPEAVVAHFGPNGRIVSALKNAGIIGRMVPCATYFHAFEISAMSAQQLASKYKSMMGDGSIFMPISQLWADKLIKAGARPEKVIVSHMGVDLSAIPYRRRTSGAPKMRLLTVGRLVEKKGHEYAIRAVAKLLGSNHCDISYDIIGDGPLRGHLGSLIDELGVGGSVRLRGAMPHAAVKEALYAADVFVLPSVTSSTGDMEGIPVALMEAMSAGLVCVSTFHSGIPELITDRATGYLCRERNADDIARALQEIQQASQERLDSITQQARAQVQRQFDRRSLIDDLVAALQPPK